MKKIVLLIIIVIATIQLKSQCFEIQSVLVDACAGSQEAQNEMVIFKVGSTALNTASLSVTWPNNSWLGLTKNASTAADVATVNATILGCGYLREPVGGVLPANAKVLLVTSTAWTPLAQSFVNLTDTLYIIFQTAGNTTGHFANYTAGGGLRTLTISFSSPVGCSDAVTYDRALLINQAGNPGGQDGGAVEFTPSGTASYVNHGCQAPYIPLAVDAGPNQTICANASQSFSATASGSYTSINWSLGAGALGNFVPTNSLSTVYTPGIAETGVVKLYCTVVKTCGTQTTTVKDSVSLNVIPLPTLTISPTATLLCNGQSAILQANTNTAVSYTWSTGASTNSISLNTSGTYSVNVSNSCAQVSSSVFITSSPTPTISISTSTSILCPSSSATLTALSNETNYSWSNAASTATTSVNSAGVYTVSVSNLCGAASASISITTMQTPTISVASTSSVLCPNGNATLTAFSNENNYSWSSGATTNTASVNTAGVYSVSVSNVCGQASSSVSITSLPTPTISIASSTTILCPSNSAVLSALSNETNYSWSNTATTSTISVNSAGVYTASVSNLCGVASASISITTMQTPTISVASTSSVLCPNGSATLIASSNENNYNWSSGATTNSISVNSNGIYSVTVSNLCGQASSSITISSLPIPTISVSSSTTSLCPGSSAILTALSNINNYSWSSGATTNTTSINSSGVYSVTVSNFCGQATASISIAALPMPTVTVTPSSNILCPGSSATLTAISNATNYSWSSGETTNVIVVNTSGVKTVSVSNACGTATASVNISNFSFPSLVLTSSSNSICPNEIATLTVTGGVPLTTGSPVVYSWSNSLSTNSIVTTSGGVVAVSNTNVCGTTSQTINVVVVNVNANISATPTGGVKPLLVNFTNNSACANSYVWDFGNGNSATTQLAPSQTYSVAGSYTVYLTATNGLCSDVDFVVINVLNEEPTIIVPNVFTPNDDHSNDIFKVKGFNIIDFKCVIFDRWGLQMYSWNDINEGWDGLIDGKSVPDGTYFYLINAKDINQKDIKMQGFFQLIK